MKKYNYILDIVPPFNMQDIMDINNIKGNVLIKIKNTKGLTSKMLSYLKSNIDIRVEGGYNNKRIDLFKDVIYEDNETGRYFYDSVIYTRNELIDILKEIEKLESNIDKDFSDLDKVVYFYQKLKSDIMYAPNHLSEPSSETRSLRGLVTKQTVCAGYALIFKELMDRNNIKCDYVEGKVLKSNNEYNIHAWNILELNGKKYGIDLTYENAKYRTGKFNTFYHFGTNSKRFSLLHIPYEFEELQDYDNNLSELDSRLIRKTYERLFKTNKHKNNIYTIKKDNGNTSLICHEGYDVINGIAYNRYYYIEDYNSCSYPIIIYSEFNLTNFIYSKVNREKKYTSEECLKVANKLFSFDNILDSINKNTLYIGNVYSNIDDVIKKEKDINNFRKTIKTIMRNEDNYLIIELINKDNDFYKYNIYEFIKEDDKVYLETNVIYSLKDLIFEEEETLFTRENIEKIINENNRIFDGNILVKKTL